MQPADHWRCAAEDGVYDDARTSLQHHCSTCCWHLPHAPGNPGTSKDQSQRAKPAKRRIFDNPRPTPRPAADVVTFDRGPLARRRRGGRRRTRAEVRWQPSCTIFFHLSHVCDVAQRRTRRPHPGDSHDRPKLQPRSPKASGPLRPSGKLSPLQRFGQSASGASPDRPRSAARSARLLDRFVSDLPREVRHLWHGPHAAHRPVVKTPWLPRIVMEFGYWMFRFPSAFASRSASPRT